VIALEHDELRGSFPPLVTPFRAGEIDEDAFAELVERHARSRSRGIVVNGTTGTPTTLSAEERARLVRVAVDAAAGRIAVVAATGAQSLDETLWLSDEAVRAGADALLVVTPYFSKPPQRGLVAYFERIGHSFELPLLAYHIPGRAAVDLQPSTMEQIAELVPTFVGVKHASTDLNFVTDVLRRLGTEFRILVGLEALSLPMLVLGASGLVNAVGNLAPDTVADLCDAVERDDLSRARKLHTSLEGLNEAIFFETNPIPLKYMMQRMGLLATDEHRLPLVPAEEPLQLRLDAVLEDAGLLA
jgi:4-hydroxy-tetrahydrodipicolinate synthase